MTTPPTLASYLESIQLGMESGRYGQTLALIQTALGDYPNHGNLRLWQAIVTQALGDTPQAITLMEGLLHHPQVALRRDARRFLGIWQAPQLRRPAAWMSEIPDLSQLDPEGGRFVAPARPPRPPVEAAPLESDSGSSYAVIGFMLGVVTVGTCLGFLLGVGR